MITDDDLIELPSYFNGLPLAFNNNAYDFSLAINGLRMPEEWVADGFIDVVWRHNSSEGRVEFWVDGNDDGQFSEGDILVYLNGISILGRSDFVDQFPAWRGTQGNDTQLLNAQANIAYGLGGNDVLSGLDGNDAIHGGTGNDTLAGDTGSDELDGNSGNDILSGGDGQDNLYGGAGSDTLNGGNDADTLNAAFDALLFGSVSEATALNTLNGDAGNDYLYGYDGRDTLNGGADDDYLFGGDNADTLNGNDGADALNGDAGNDVLNGGTLGDYLDGGTGTDRLIGGAGADTLIGGVDGDVFVLTAASESTASVFDVIEGFDGVGAASGDRIDISAIDANPNIAGDQAFTFGSTALGGLWLTQTGTDTYVRGNIDSDAEAEFTIRIHDGVAIPSQYTGGDFIL